MLWTIWKRHYQKERMCKNDDRYFSWFEILEATLTLQVFIDLSFTISLTTVIPCIIIAELHGASPGSWTSEFSKFSRMFIKLKLSLQANGTPSSVNNDFGTTKNS